MCYLRGCQTWRVQSCTRVNPDFQIIGTYSSLRLSASTLKLTSNAVLYRVALQRSRFTGLDALWRAQSECTFIVASITVGYIDAIVETSNAFSSPVFRFRSSYSICELYDGMARKPLRGRRSWRHLILAVRHVLIVTSHAELQVWCRLRSAHVLEPLTRRRGVKRLHR